LISQRRFDEKSAKKDKSSCEGAYSSASVTEQKRSISKQFSIKNQSRIAE
jgi:hypothetical protein